MSRYSAFISYSHADHAVARWLHRAIETYRLPRALVGTESPFGPVPRRLPPVFRDRDELPASSDLGQELRAALADSRFQIVLCSPRSAKSKWVNEEILAFKRLHGEARTLALIVDGEPYTGQDDECFPPALRFKLAPDGSLSDTPAEPIAADIRKGKDGRRLALLKLLAGITGLQLDRLARRDAARRQRRMMWVTGASLGIAAITIGLAIYAELQRREAVAQRNLADKSLEFLVDTFKRANPATENPRTITALTILERASRRASVELRGEPRVSARLLRTTGDIYLGLGLPKEAERDLRASLALLPERGEERANTLLRLAVVAYRGGDAKASSEWIDAAERAFGPRDRFAPLLRAKIAERRGMVERLDGKYAAAVKTLGDAAERFRKLGKGHALDLARVSMNQGLALIDDAQFDTAGLARTRDARYDQADALFTRTAEIYAAQYGVNHVLTANAVQNRAFADFEKSALAEAEKRIGQALTIYNKVLEPDHPTIGDAQLMMGRIRTGRGDARGALAALDKARGIFLRLYGPMNAAVADADFYAAEAALKGREIDAALRRLASAKAVYDEIYDPDDPDQVEVLLLKSRVLAAGKRMPEARAACEAGLAMQIRLDPKDTGIADKRKTCAALKP